MIPPSWGGYQNFFFFERLLDFFFLDLDLDIAKLLREIGIIPFASTGNKLRAKVDYDTLLEIYQKRKWISQYDEEEDDDDEIKVPALPNQENYKDRYYKMKKFAEDIQDENLKLKEELARLKGLLTDKPVEKKEIKKEIKPAKEITTKQKKTFTSAKEIEDTCDIMDSIIGGKLKLN